MFAYHALLVAVPARIAVECADGLDENGIPLYGKLRNGRREGMGTRGEY
jgi:hypothetical protein